jgi:hypothetical protein
LCRNDRLGESHVGLHFIPPGEPWRNGYIESFNSRIRDDCLNINSFWSLAQARVIITDWKHDYNHHRHSALGHQPPSRYAASCTRGTTLVHYGCLFTAPVLLGRGRGERTCSRTNTRANMWDMHDPLHIAGDDIILPWLARGSAIRFADDSLAEQVSAVAAAKVAKYPEWGRRVEEIFP